MYETFYDLKLCTVADVLTTCISNNVIECYIHVGNGLFERG